MDSNKFFIFRFVLIGLISAASVVFVAFVIIKILQFFGIM
jgi:hypothetical protein